MTRWERLWLAFEKFAIFFSFLVTFTLVMILLLSGFVLWLNRDLILSLKAGLACDTIVGLNTVLEDFENAVITETVYVSDTIPVVFDLPLEQTTVTQLSAPVPLNRPANFVLPAGGGRINGTVFLELPSGLKLPIQLDLIVPVSQTVPVNLAVPVTIPLKDTDLGKVIYGLQDLVKPLHLRELEEFLGCSAPGQD